MGPLGQWNHHCSIIHSVVWEGPKYLWERSFSDDRGIREVSQRERCEWNRGFDPSLRKFVVWGWSWVLKWSEGHLCSKISWANTCVNDWFVLCWLLSWDLCSCWIWVQTPIQSRLAMTITLNRDYNTSLKQLNSLMWTEIRTILIKSKNSTDLWD